MSDFPRRLYEVVVRMRPVAFGNEFGCEMALDFEDALHSYGLGRLWRGSDRCSRAVDLYGRSGTTWTEAGTREGTGEAPCHRPSREAFGELKKVGSVNHDAGEA